MRERPQGGLSQYRREESKLPQEAFIAALRMGEE